MSTFDRFPIASRTVVDGRQTVRLAKCVCGFEGFIIDSSPSGLPPEAVARKLGQRGWDIGRTAAHDRCPRCSGRSSRTPLTPPQKRAAFCRIAGVARAGSPKEPIMTATNAHVADALGVAAEAPREPTREDKRKIVDRLDRVYAVGEDRYTKNHSDETVAKFLDVPPAWVAQLRDDLYGPDVNEVATQRAAAIDKVEADAQAIEDRILKLSDDVDALKREVRRLKGVGP